jgi:predicted ribosome quality control (RQC) complex YloA/Tae2 family protein
VRQRGADLVRTAANARDRLRRKLTQQEQDYAATKNRETLRLYGELLTANLHRMTRGQASLTCENYYDEGHAITIPLDPLCSPQENAAKYFKRYQKAKTAEKMLGEQMTIARRDMAYLESVLEEIAQGETEQDFIEIRRELQETGFLRQKGQKKKGRERVSKPREFWSGSGLRILIGRNNRQNDQLTAAADGRDLWFHTQKIHGAHVILCAGGREADEGSIEEAAKLAAWYSQGRESGKVAVDYAPVKQVKKPAGSRPGMVVYNKYRTIYVSPEKR